jgi:hypothetical protein
MGSINKADRKAAEQSGQITNNCGIAAMFLVPLVCGVSAPPPLEPRSQADGASKSELAPEKRIS